MIFYEKVEAFLSEAKTEGIPLWTVAPLPYRFFWWLGIQVPPPLFLRRWTVVLLEGVFFSLVFGLWFFQFFALHETIFCALLTGTMYGLVAGMQHYDLNRMLHQAPSWERYIPGIGGLSLI